ncbi:MAG: hypothetical protein MJ147_10410, partial [Clostridia bacterium]|nr:hypothetical protein [Clostridia bacterium]
MSLPFVKIYANKMGTGFFAAPEYIVTCRHILDGYAVGEKVKFRFNDEIEIREAEIVDILQEDDLALLKSPIIVKEHYVFDRVVICGKKVGLKGFSNNSEKFSPAKATINGMNGEGLIELDDANAITLGYSGSAVYLKEDESSVVGVLKAIAKIDKNERKENIARAIPASVILDAWGEYVCEKRYTPEGMDRHPRNDFVYQALKTDFIGRDAEMEQLEMFIQHDDYRPLLWQAIVAEGGSGKSRLAYEFAHSLDSSWYCKLVRQEDLTVSNLNNIYEEAGRNLFLIADYAYTDTNELGKWIDTVLQGAPKHDIRVLLLQRQGDSEQSKAKWHESLEKNNHNISRHMFSPDIYIQPLNMYDIYTVIKSYAEKKGKSLDDTSCTQLYEALERVDPELLRPLFAMFITDAYLENSAEPLNWNRDDALDYFCNREIDLITDATSALGDDYTEAAHLLTVLATMAGGYSFAKDSLPDFEVFEVIDNVGYKLCKKGIAYKTENTYTVDAITPDILGEYFVKMYLEKHFYDIPKIIEAAESKSILATNEFLSRLFTDHEADIDFIEKCCCNPFNAYSVSWGLVNRADTAKLSVLYESHKSMDDSALWSIQYAKGLFNFFYRQTDMAEAKKVLEKLEDLHNISNNAEVTVVYAKGLTNYIGRQTDMAEAKKALEKLEDLHKNSNNAEVTVVYAKGLTNYIGRQTDMAEAKKALEKLEDLHKNSNNAEVTVEYASGLTNYIGRQTNMAEAKKAFEKLEDLHKSSNNAEVTVEYAQGLTNYIGRQTDMAESKKALEKLEDLHNISNNAEVTVVYAKGLTNYIGRQTDMAEAKKALEKLEDLHNISNNAEVTVVYAKGLTNYIGRQTDMAEAKKALEKLEDLHNISNNA